MTAKVAKIVRTIPQAVVKSDDTQLSLEKEVETALKNNDAIEIAKVQLKLSASILEHLTKIDWKLWEFYNKLGK